jgi:hypothetical protein
MLLDGLEASKEVEEKFVLCYADDLVLLAKEETVLQSMINISESKTTIKKNK